MVVLTTHLQSIYEMKAILTHLQSYRDFDICILGIEQTNFDFLKIFQGHFEDHL